MKRIVFVVCIILTSLATPLALLAYAHGHGDWAFWFRMGASTGFFATALAGGGLRTWYGRLMLLGLVGGWWGDLFLLGGRDQFLKGLLAFLLGHVAYSAAFLVHRSNLKNAAWTCLGLAIVMALVSRAFWTGVPSRLHVPVLTYMIVITIMASLAAGTIKRPGGWVILLGAVLFYVSDFCVAYRAFAESSRMIAFIGLLLYAAGQVFLAVSVAFVRGRATVTETREAA